MHYILSLVSGTDIEKVVMLNQCDFHTFSQYRLTTRPATLTAQFDD